MAERVSISSTILEWAITRAGYDLSQYLACYPQVEEWIKGDKQPTIKQVEALAGQLHVPFGYLFLQTPPVETSPIPFFRGDANDGRLDLNTQDTVLSLQRRQEWLSEYLQDNEFANKPFVGCASIGMSVPEIEERMRDFLGLSPTWAFKLTSNDQAVNTFTEVLEENGIVVEFNGVVGNNTHRPIDVKECRGFSLVSPIAPFIFVNSADSKSAQLFTLAHEFVHLMLGFSSGFGGDNGVLQNKTERLCDRVAAEFLVPPNVFVENWSDIYKTARKFKVSPLVIARRAKELGLITGQEFQAFYAEYLASPYCMERKSGGGNFIAITRKRLGYTFAVHVNNAMKSNQLSPIEAYRLTGLYGQTYTKFMSSL